MNDRELHRLVLEELAYDPSVEAAGIDVSTDNGLVTLRGCVPACPQRFVAERAAWRVKGVRGVDAQLEVRLPDDKEHDDEEIAMRVRIVFAWHSSICGDALRVKVVHGWVTLTGRVDWHYQRAAAEAAVRGLDGVRGITNKILLAPAPQARGILRQIRHALGRHAEIGSGDIRVAVRDSGTVRVEGRVGNWSARQAVERAVWSAPGVRRVEDRLEIS